MATRFTGKIEIELGFTDKIMVMKIHNLSGTEGYYTPSSKRLFSKVEIDSVCSKYDLEQPRTLECKNEVFRGEKKDYKNWLVTTILTQYLQYGVICGVELPFDEESARARIESFIYKHIQESNL